MNWLQLQPSSIPLLSEFLLAFFLALYLGITGRNSNDARRLAAALAATGAFLFSFFLTNSLYSPLWMYFVSATHALALVFLYQLLRFAYGFLKNPFQKEARVVLTASRLVIALFVLFIGFQLSAYQSVQRFVFRVIDILILILAIWLVIVFLRKTVVLSSSFSRRGKHENRSRKDAASRSKGLSRIRDALLHPTTREAQAHRHLLVLFLVVILVALTGLLRDVGIVTENLFNHILFIGIMTLLLGLVLIYTRFTTDSTTLLIKLVGVTLAAILAVLGLAGLLLVSPDELARQAGNEAPTQQSIRFVPQNDGGYLVEEVPFRFDSDYGDPIGLKDGRQFETPIGFPFPLGNGTWETMTIEDNAVIHFSNLPPTSQQVAWYDFSRDLVSIFTQNELPKLAPFFSRLNPSLQGDILLDRNDHRTLITWSGVPDYLTSSKNTFQVELHADGIIYFNYHDLSSQLRWGGIGFFPGGSSPDFRDIDFTGGLPTILPEGTAVVENFMRHYRQAAHSRMSAIALLILVSALIVVFILPLFYRFTILRPLVTLLSGVQKVNEGDLETKVQVRVHDEIGYLSRSFNEMTRSLKEADEQIRSYTGNLEKMVQQRTEELNASLEVLTRTKDELLEMSQLKSRFFGNISHEFRTPLTLILGPIQDALDEAYGPLTPPFRKQLRLVRRNGYRLQNLINQLLDLSKIEAGRMKVHAEPHNLVAFLIEMVRMFTPLAERRRVTLKFRKSRDRITAVFDEEMLEKILSNLLSNAFKFTSENGTVELSVSETASHVEIRVRDSGPGISTDDLPGLFTRFYQGQALPAHGVDGTGIGLALSRELIELQKGTISVESTPGEGATFILQLPRAYPESEGEYPLDGVADVHITPLPLMFTEETSDGTGKEGQTVSATEAPLIVIIDDNEDIRVYLRSHLESMYRVMEAKDGAEGLENVRKFVPDLVICDVMMPGLDGFSVCEAIKSDEQLRHIPVVLLTAKAAEEAKIEGLSIGADDYLYKPFNLRELLVRVENLIELRRVLRRQFSQEFVVEPSGISVTSQDSVFLEQVRSCVEEHLSNSNFGVEWLADEVGMSARHLQRRLKALTRMSAAGFIRTLRLKRAAHLLEEKAGTISEIAYQVGFRDPSHFSKVFHQVYGVSPSNYPAEEARV